MTRRRFLGSCLSLLAGAALAPAAGARGAGKASLPTISIIIDDIGYELAGGLRAVALPGPVTCSVLPDTPHADRLARAAHRAGKEVMVHLPMQATEALPLGPGGLTLDMTEQAFRASVARSIAAVPHARGVNNHMGSLLTRHPGHMAWLMEELRHHRDLYFVDSRTTDRSVARQVAREHAIPGTQRDIFLDTIPGDRAYVRQQFIQLVNVARHKGHAVAIGHPYPATLDVLEDHLAHLDMLGVQLVPVSQRIREEEAPRLWQASWSPSPTAARNSKPSP
ncbi:MAG: divergent polysaccharide deacetylase family protein [Chromatiales bacterium]|jgi:polysaccharide deacetylase 2 family uncharacterized protein YibQ|nr:divergent polysaccharide deacetylase family protein [Chromatiales bacterium]MDX9768064.1 divergent polysaccharide deacetylase family protein [Ectothiorhodospiraceae bacterium]